MIPIIDSWHYPVKDTWVAHCPLHGTYFPTKHPAECPGCTNIDPNAHFYSEEFEVEVYEW